MAALLGVVACVTAPIGIGWLITTRGARGPNTRLAEFLAATDGIVGVLLFGLVLSAMRPTSFVAVPGLRALSNFAVSLAVGLALGWLADFILHWRRWSDPEYLLWLIGLVVFSSGAAHSVGQSPLVINFVMGVVLVNFSHQSERVTKSLGGAEASFYILFLILAGASWSFDVGWEWILICPYVLMRIVGKVGGVALGRRLCRVDFTPRGDLGLAMLSQGGLALTMIINVGLVLPRGGHLAALESLVIVSIVLNQLMGPAWAEVPLRRSGELRTA
jgi:Kef-type K+ transport system membrane component KefB